MECLLPTFPEHLSQARHMHKGYCPHLAGEETDSGSLANYLWSQSDEEVETGLLTSQSPTWASGRGSMSVWPSRDYRSNKILCEIWGLWYNWETDALFPLWLPLSLQPSLGFSHSAWKQNRRRHPPTPGQPFPTWSSLELPAHLCLSPLCPFSWSEIPKTQLANKLFFPNSIFYFKRAFFFVFFLETYALLQRCNLTHRCFLKGGTSVWGTFRSVWSFRLCNSLSNCCPGHCPAHLQKQASSPPFLLPYRIIQRGKIYLLYHMTPKLVSNQTSYRKRPGTLQMNVRKLAFGRVRLIHEHWWDFDFLWPYK